MDGCRVRVAGTQPAPLGRASRRTAVTADYGQEPLHGMGGVVSAHGRQGVEGVLGQR